MWVGLFAVITWASNIRMCLPNSVISERWYEGSCPLTRETLKPLSDHVLYKTVLRKQLPCFSVTHSQMPAVFIQKCNPEAHNSTLGDSTQEIHVSQMT